MTYLNYTADVETIPHDEEQLIERIGQVMVKLAETVRAKHGVAMKGTHAKAVGTLNATLTVAGDLPPELAQGLFSHPATYEALVRVAPGPPEKLSDKVSGQRGLSIKVLGAEGERVAIDDESTTQDFVLAVDPVFNAATAADFLAFISRTGAKTPHVPEQGLILGSRLARGAEAVLESVGLQSGNLKFLGRPPRHPMSDAYYSQAPIRYGDFFGKIAVFPSERTLTAIGDPRADVSDDDVFRHQMSSFFAEHEAVFDVKVQLCTDLASMPVEDASVAWPEDDSPYRTVATLTIPSQRSLTPERERYFDDRLSFNPVHALEAHRPLGSIMRARMAVYQQTTAFRRAANGVGAAEPRSLAEVPS